MTPAIERFLSERKRRTPCLVIDLERVAAAWREVRNAFPDADVHYAVKANPAPQIVRRLADLGSSFDVAGRNEIATCLRLGVAPERLSYGNTVKKAADIAWAFRQGVRRFAFDSEDELAKLARHAPGAAVACRIAVDNAGAAWPMGRKFGCNPDLAVELMREAAARGLEATGLSFHVGSQQTDPSSWDRAAARAAGVAARLADEGLPLRSLNVGGGFPVRYDADVPAPAEIAAAVRGALRRHFGTRPPALRIEPGRCLVAEAGVIESEVILVSRRSATDRCRWVYLDIGRFGGLAETEDRAIRYPIEPRGVNGPAGPVVIAGPSCDGSDVLYEDAGYRMPLGLGCGDRVRIGATGAYTSVYASSFNGVPRLRTHFV